MERQIRMGGRNQIPSKDAIGQIISDLQLAADYLRADGLGVETRQLVSKVLRYKPGDMSPLVAIHNDRDQPESYRAAIGRLLKLLGKLYRLRPVPPDFDAKGNADLLEKLAGKLNAGYSGVAKSPSGRVVLYGRADKPRIDGKEVKKKLTSAQYDVILALLKAGEAGLTKDELAGSKTGRGGGIGVLKRLAEKPGWKGVIKFAGITGGRYRIL